MAVFFPVASAPRTTDAGLQTQVGLMGGVLSVSDYAHSAVGKYGVRLSSYVLCERRAVGCVSQYVLCVDEQRGV